MTNSERQLPRRLRMTSRRGEDQLERMAIKAEEEKASTRILRERVRKLPRLRHTKMRRRLQHFYLLRKMKRRSRIPNLML